MIEHKPSKIGLIHGLVDIERKQFEKRKREREREAERKEKDDYQEPLESFTEKKHTRDHQHHDDDDDDDLPPAASMTLHKGLWYPLK